MARTMFSARSVCNNLRPSWRPQWSLARCADASSRYRESAHEDPSHYERLPTTKQKMLICSTSISVPPIFQMMLWQMTGSPASFGMGLSSTPLTMRCSSIGTQSISAQSTRPFDDLTGLPSRAHQRPSDRSSASVTWQSFFEQQLTSPGRLRLPYQASRSGRLRSWL